MTRFENKMSDFFAKMAGLVGFCLTSSALFFLFLSDFFIGAVRLHDIKSDKSVSCNMAGSEGVLKTGYLKVGC